MQSATAPQSHPTVLSSQGCVDSAATCPSKGTMQQGLQITVLASVKGQDGNSSLCEMKDVCT